MRLPSPDVATSWAALETKMLPRPTIVEQSVDPESTGTVPLQFYLRLPLGETDGSQVSGVLAYCTWEQDKVSLEQDLMVDTNRIGKQSESTSVEMVKYATEHNLALLTWSTPGNWNPQTGNEGLSDSERSREDRLFDDYSRAWDQPNALSPVFAVAMYDLKAGLDRVKLPESVAREFFEELWRTWGTAARPSITPTRTKPRSSACRSSFTRSSGRKRSSSSRKPWPQANVTHITPLLIYLDGLLVCLHAKRN